MHLLRSVTIVRLFLRVESDINVRFLYYKYASVFELSDSRDLLECQNNIIYKTVG